MNLAIIFRKVARLFSKENMPYVMAITITVLVFLYINSCNRLRDEKKRFEEQQKIAMNNYSALKDSIRLVSDKMGNVLAVKTSLITSIDDLKKMYPSLYNEIKAIKGEIISQIHSTVNVDVPKVEVDNSLKRYPDSSTYGLLFSSKYKDDGMSYGVNGESQFRLLGNKIYPAKTVLDSSFFEIGLRYGFRELADKWEVYATSPSKLVKFRELDGVLLLHKPMPTPCPTPRRLTLSISAGYMFMPLTGKFGFAVGPTVSYKLLSLPARNK